MSIFTILSSAVGGPCHTVEFCSDPIFTDPAVIDHCGDIWTDTNECPDEKAGDKCYDEWDAPGKGTCLELYCIRHVQGGFAV